MIARALRPVLRAALTGLVAAAVCLSAPDNADAQEAASAAAPDSTISLTAEQRASYLGTYEIETPDGVMAIRVYEESDRLMALPEHDNEPSPLIPLGDHRFRPALMREAVLTFSLDEGRATNFAIEFPDERGTVIAFRKP